MDDHLEEMLREEMRKGTESASLPQDTAGRVLAGRLRRTRVRRRLVAGGAAGALAAVALIAGLVFGVVLPQTGGKPGGAQAGSKTSAHLSGGVTTTRVSSITSPSDKDGALPVIFVNKILAAATVSESEILHVVMREVSKSSRSVRVDETWSIGGDQWKYRSQGRDGRMITSDRYFDSTGLQQSVSQTYDRKNRKIVYGTIYETHIDNYTGGGWTDYVGVNGYSKKIKSLLTSGDAFEDGHELVDGRDATRIRTKEETDQSFWVYLIDTQTGVPLAIRLYDTDTVNKTVSVTTASVFDVYEKLPATEENLKKLDLEAAYPDAVVKPGSKTGPN